MQVQGQKSVAELQAEFLARGGAVVRCPTHSITTGSARFNGARRKKRVAEGSVVTYRFRFRGEDGMHGLVDVDARSQTEAEEGFQRLYPDATMISSKVL
jgi:hypothetical protein